MPHRNLEAKVGHVQSPDQLSQLTSSARKRKSETLIRLSSIKSARKQIFSVHDDIPSTSRQQQTQLTPTKEKHTIVVHSPSGYFDVTPQKLSVAVQVDIPVREAKHTQKSSVALQVCMPAKEKKHFRSVAVNTRIRQIDKASSPVKLPKTKLKIPVEVLSPVKSESSVSSSDNTKSYESTTSSTEEHFKVPSMGRRNSTEYLCEKRSRFYLGLPEHVYQVVKFIVEVEKIHHVDVLITLKKIRTDDVYARLADDFEMSVTYIHNIFTRSVPIIAGALQELIFWPSSTEIKKLLPIPFRVRYKNVVSIIDCLEIEIEKPSNPIHQALTWSEYKKCNTLKFLISSTPDGMITFISGAVGGRASDKEIISQSNFLNELPDACAVMADRGFKQIDFMLAKKNCLLVRPPSVEEGQILSKEKMKESKRIASLRIHIERLIRRLREFASLDIHARVNTNLLYLVNHMVLIACGIINVQGPLIM